MKKILLTVACMIIVSTMAFAQMSDGIDLNVFGVEEISGCWKMDDNANNGINAGMRNNEEIEFVFGGDLIDPGTGSDLVKVSLYVDASGTSSQDVLTMWWDNYTGSDAHNIEFADIAANGELVTWTVPASIGTNHNNRLLIGIESSGATLSVYSIRLEVGSDVRTFQLEY
jgi:hypothetical protein